MWGGEVVLRSCILVSPGHRRAVNHCATSGAEQGLGETCGPRPSPLLPLHSVTKPSTYPHGPRHFGPIQSTHSHTQLHNSSIGTYVTPGDMHMYAWSCALTVALLATVQHTLTFTATSTHVICSQCQCPLCHRSQPFHNPMHTVIPSYSDTHIMPQSHTCT
ncbi:hypothetical protein HJG60_007937 [Phyllostomus discolor]|uniref:Uncharacterized protein n=1 Tax=Phyllostomus discolor TaxID=89673 RepID=A0A834ERS0_9CHIR|nr:hypothetical protein HJG60_007937 [Phyllostomus discolor]